MPSAVYASSEASVKAMNENCDRDIPFYTEEELQTLPAHLSIFLNMDITATIGLVTNAYPDYNLIK